MNLKYRPVKNLVSVLLLHVIFFFMTDASCQAYFNANTDTLSKPTITNHAGALPLSFSNYLVWINNNEHIQHFSSDMSNSQQQSTMYLHAFYMPLIEIMTQAKVMRAPSEFSLENLLYANLKIKRLLDEYNSLKERSKLILEGLEVPHISQQFGLDSDNKGSGFTMSNRLYYVNNHIGILADTSLSGQIANNRILRPKFRTNRQSKTTEQPYASKEAPIQTYRTLLGEPQKFVGDDEVESDLVDPEQFGSSQYDRLPFVERIVRSLLDHLKKNKIELIIYLIILFGLYRILFGRRKI